MKKLKLQRIKLYLLFGLTALIILTSCDGASEDTKQESILRIGSSTDRTNWHHTTQLYEAFQPNVKFEFVTATEPLSGEDWVESLIAFASSPQPPDVMILNYDEFRELQNNNLLAPLDHLLAEDSSMREESFMPLMLNSLRSESDHSLYGLAPELQSHALIYNKKIFEHAGVAPPDDQMTWKELLALAESVTVVDEDNPIYGFSFSPHRFGEVNFQDIDRWYAPVSDVPLLENEELNPQWIDIFMNFDRYQKSGMFPAGEAFTEVVNGIRGDAFLSGRLAMTIVSNKEAYRYMMNNLNATNIEGYEPIEWEVVMLPIRDDTSEPAANINFNAIFAIHAGATNPALAWDFISFVHSQDWASLHAGEDRLLTRMDYPGEIELDYRQEVFYSYEGDGESNRFYDKRRNHAYLEDVASAWNDAISEATFLTLDKAMENMAVKWAKVEEAYD